MVHKMGKIVSPEQLQWDEFTIVAKTLSKYIHVCLVWGFGRKF